MCAPIAAKHAAAEPWLAYLRDNKLAGLGRLVPCGLLSTAPQPRELIEAATETAVFRASQKYFGKRVARG